MTTGGEWLVPAGFIADHLQNTAQAIGAPLGVEVRDLLVLGQQMQAILQRVFAGSDGEFIEKALAGKGHLRGIDGTQPSQRDGAWRRDILDAEVGDEIEEGSLVFQVGIDAAVAWLALLAGDGGRDEAMRKRNRPTLRVEHRAQVVDAGRAIGGEAHVVFARPHHLDRRVNGFRN